MKILLSLAFAFLTSFSAHAAEYSSMDLNIFPGSPVTEANLYYSYDFGFTSVRVPLYVDFNLKNHGPDKLGIRRVGISGMDFDAYHNCPPVLVAGKSCNLRVSFNPWNEGFKVGQVIISTSEGFIQIDLSGWARNY